MKVKVYKVDINRKIYVGCESNNSETVTFDVSESHLVRVVNSQGYIGREDGSISSMCERETRRLTSGFFGGNLRAVLSRKEQRKRSLSFC
ncbi:uncharacterized protein Gasu_48370 [Galdieria sulphuraria]|uniref:Uncharacterized protein n=1 Tax=Galdieria sulphuraria TaxID=130081 RepID=M2VWS2_GALSU|nr:uncharacterized protein Gasu_48370 [Galdieria sulphuraria]EME27696.1 hypothetical protein Gasu_48370 [Galdieria sulphuraria]|eukprot:XP_005704216.1 hypothetical protein Gasu_48370 [Galdieria sulphuraria]